MSERSGQDIDHADLRGRIEAARRRAMNTDDDSDETATGIRTTSTVDHIVTEARIATNVDDHGSNYAVPENADVLERALAQIDKKELTPAWEVVDGVEP